MILRDMKLRASVADVLDGLRSSGLDDDEPWTEQRVLERHDLFCAAACARRRSWSALGLWRAACMSWWPCAYELELSVAFVLRDGAHEHEREHIASTRQSILQSIWRLAYLVERSL